MEELGLVAALLVAAPIVIAVGVQAATRRPRAARIAGAFAAAALPEVEAAVTSGRPPKTLEQLVNGEYDEGAVWFAAGRAGSTEVWVGVTPMQPMIFRVAGYGFIGWNETMIAVVRYDRKSGASSIHTYVFNAKRQQVTKAPDDVPVAS